jgi:hypothetical protein
MTLITTQKSANFRVAPQKEFRLKSSGHKITVKEVDRKADYAKVYLHSVARHVWIPIALIRAWYVQA